MPIATIIGAIIAAGATVAGGVMGVRATERANEKNLELAEQDRQDALQKWRDTLKEQARNRELQQQQLGMSRRQLDLTEREYDLNRKERMEEKGYNRLQHAADQYTQYLNNKQVLVKNRLSPLMRSG
jgi:C-terminal processing protease CtpA/Prc